MAEPKPRSYQQILGDQIDTFLAGTGIDDLHTASAIRRILEASAQSDFRSSQDIFAVMDANSIDRARADALDRIGEDENLPRRAASFATGNVTFLDNSFTKISTKIYPGLAAPNVGSVTVFVVDASEFPASGQVYLGRGTPNIEGPISYTSKVQVGSYWQLNLAAGTSKFHNLSEGVVLAQGGNRIITSGTVVQTPGGDAFDPIQFSTTINVTIPDGEDSLTNVPVVAAVAGTQQGNIPRNTIAEVLGAPYPNAAATNPLPFTTAQDQESDDAYRERIKDTRQSRGKGTPLAIKTAAVGIIAPDEPKRVLSANVIEFESDPTTLFIDDGTGYEELVKGIGQANVVDQALGGEEFLQLPDTVIAKAHVVSTEEEPFQLYGSEVLAVKINGTRIEHTFSADDFASPGAATAFEIVSSINSNPVLSFSASTAEGTKRVRLFAKVDLEEDIQVVPPSSGTDANTVMGFSESITHTLMFYKNDELLYKDGAFALVEGLDQSLWNASITSGDNLWVAVDSTDPREFTFTDADFVNAGTGYSTVAYTNSVDSWAAVLNYKIPGITARVSGAKIEILSNKGRDDGAAVEILNEGSYLSDLVSKDMFVAVLSTGKTSDYKLNRNTGQIRLSVPLVEFDKVTAGSLYTRGYTEGGTITGGGITFASDAKFFVIMDGQSTAIANTANAGTTMTITNPSTGIWRYTSSVGSAFASVLPGDWFVAWDPALSSDNLGYWRVSSTDAATWVEVERDDAIGTVEAPTLSGGGGGSGISFARSEFPMQEITIPAGTYTVSAVSALINAQAITGHPVLIGGESSVVGGDRVRLTPSSFSLEGGSNVVSADTSAKLLLFPENEPVANRQSHIAFVESGQSEVGTPFFFDETVSTGDSTEPPVTISLPTAPVTLGANENSMIGFLRPFGAGRFSSNKYNHTQLSNIPTGSPLDVDLEQRLTMKGVLAGDRLFMASPYDFGSEDTVVVSLDNDPVGKTFSIPLARGMAVSSQTSSSEFDAYDTDSGPAVSPEDSFGEFFLFDNYKVWMKARTVLDPSGSLNAILYRYAQFGPSGERARVGYFYPTSELQDPASVVSTGEYTTIKVFLPSDAKRFLSHDAATTLSVSIVAGPPDTVTYTAAGTSPLFVTNNVVAGDIISIGSGSSLSTANQGAFRITNVVDENTIEIERPAGDASAEGPLSLNAVDNMTIFPLAGTAAQVMDYVNSNLSTYLEAELTPEDPASTPNDGSGMITTSTLDENLLTGVLYEDLVDGENYVLSTDLASSPQFTLKFPLAFAPAAHLYSFAGEPLRIIPTAAQDISEYVNTLAVTGLTSIAGFSTASAGKKVQFYSGEVGTAGAVEVAGGTANSTQGVVVGSGGIVDSTFSRIRIPYATRQGFHAGQFIRIENSASQPRSLSLGATTTVTVDGDNPIVGRSRVTIAVAGSFETEHAHSGVAGTQLQVEKHGDYVFIVYNGTGTDPDLASAGVAEGDTVYITGTNFTPSNRGTFRVVRRYNNGFYIENPLAEEEVVTLAAATDIKFVSYDSVVPGDSLVISGANLSSGNQGTWPIAEIISPTVVEVVGTMADEGTIALGSNVGQFQIFEGTPYTGIKRLHAVAQNPNDAAQLDLTLEGTVLVSKINASSLSAISAENKLGFSTSAVPGIDGYKKYSGLIAEVNRVIYGDAQDPTTYPGVRAAGAKVNIQGPLIRRISVSLSIRVRTGVPFSQVEEKVKSSVAAYVNSLGVGQSVAISSIVSAAGSVSGVLAVSVVDPLYDQTSDLIAVQGYEKALIIDADTDIVVSQIGE